MNKQLKRKIQDIFLPPLVYPAALCLRKVRRIGIESLPRSRAILNRLGCFPILDHYYEPLFRTDLLRQSPECKRYLPGIHFDFPAQIALLEQLSSYAQESAALPRDANGERTFHYNNPTFREGDAAFFYALLRHFKPANIIEIGCGNSTLLARKAIDKNQSENPSSPCNHYCIEPYENPWLDELPIEIVREPVENVNLKVFDRLGENDVLFIDSSHIIRPQGDLLRIYLEILPRLKKGVVIHIHDIFSPRDYLSQWLLDEVKFWNEQYLLEAFLSDNSRFRILASLNALHKDFFDDLKTVCPLISKESQPGSFYLQVTSDPRKHE